LGASLGIGDGGSYKNNPGFGESVAAWTVAGLLIPGGGEEKAGVEAAELVGHDFEIADRVYDQLQDSRLGSLAGNLTSDQLVGLVNNPSAQRLYDVYNQSINVVQNVDGVLLRITTASDAFRIYSVGPIRERNILNGINNGRFVPLR
jgi:hypothetical protein